VTHRGPCQPPPFCNQAAQCHDPLIHANIYEVLARCKASPYFGPKTGSTCRGLAPREGATGASHPASPALVGRSGDAAAPETLRAGWVPLVFPVCFCRTGLSPDRFPGRRVQMNYHVYSPHCVKMKCSALQGEKCMDGIV